MQTNLKIARISTISFFLVAQLKGQVEYLRDAGLDITLVSSGGDDIKKIDLSDKLRHINIYIPRRIEPFNDIAALVKLYLLFRKEDFEIVHSTTPKAGLLVAVSAWLARVPVRMHTFTGQPWQNMQGFKKVIFKTIDRFIIKLNSRCYADSRSQIQHLESEHVSKEGQIRLIGSGSLTGVDIKRFVKTTGSDEKAALLSELKIKSDSQVIIFLGRISPEKGVNELVKAFQILQDKFNVHLLLVGPEESHDNPLDTEIEEIIINSPNIHRIGYTNTTEKYLNISDILCLPSHREGFGTVIIEAASMSIPAVASDITGIRDAVEDGVTGILFPMRDYQALVESLSALLKDKNMIETMGKNARDRVVKCFDSNLVNQLVYKEYIQDHNNKGSER